MRRKHWAPLILAAFGATSCAHLSAQTPDTDAIKSGSNSIRLTSPAFANGAAIAVRYTCHGADVSPPLAWSGVPARCAGVALTCRDPDAPGGTFTHWVLWNLPPTMRQLPEGVAPQPVLPNHARQGINGFKTIGYRGACPPSGRHRYVFTIYALDRVLTLPAGGASDIDSLLAAMNGHIVATGRLIGTYSAP